MHPIRFGPPLQIVYSTGRHYDEATQMRRASAHHSDPFRSYRMNPAAVPLDPMAEPW